MSLNIWNLVISDMKHRDEMGTAKYGKPLTLHDGRRTLQDAYEEALDLAVYLKKAILEETENTDNLCKCGHPLFMHPKSKICMTGTCICEKFTGVNS